MSKRTLLAMALTVLVGVGGFAQVFTATYLDGAVELQTAKGWKAIAIGDPVPADATVRISQTGSLEMQRGKTKITLLKDGVYSMASLAAAAGTNASGGVGGTVAQKLRTIVTEKPKASAAGGVRAEQAGQNQVTWVDESDETRTRVQAMLDKSQYKEAVSLLNESIKEAGADGDVGELTYLLGVAYYGAGQTARAYRVLAKVTPQTDAAWYARYVILKSQVLVDTQNYRDALAILTPFISAYPTGEAAQVAWLLSGISQKGLGDNAAARTSFDTGFQLDPASETASLIDKERESP